MLTCVEGTLFSIIRKFTRFCCQLYVVCLLFYTMLYPFFYARTIVLVLCIPRAFSRR